MSPNGLLLASVCCNMHVLENWFQLCASSTLWLSSTCPLSLSLSTDHQDMTKTHLHAGASWMLLNDFRVFFDQAVNGHKPISEFVKVKEHVEVVLGMMMIMMMRKMMITWANLGRGNCSHLWTPAENPHEDCGGGGRGDGWDPARPSPSTHPPLQPQRSDGEKVREHESESGRCC